MPSTTTHDGRHIQLTCDCGGTVFATFGPYNEADDPCLRYIHTCLSCGEQLRVYQTGEAWRRRVKVPPGVIGMTLRGTREGGS